MFMDRPLGQAINDTSAMGVDPSAHVGNLEGCGLNDFVMIRLNGSHHLTLNKRIGIMEIGMEQAFENRFDNLMSGNIRIFPSLDNRLDSMGLRRYRLE
jgi:hypothetical protein